VQSRIDPIAKVRRIADRGTAVVYAIHYLREVETLNARVVVLESGRILAEGTAEELVGKYASAVLELVFAGPASDRLRHRVVGVTRAEGVAEDTVDRTTVLIPTEQPGRELGGVLAALGSAAERLLAVQIQQPAGPPAP
jgi:ABC-2 type transport system ATP-binding protein